MTYDALGQCITNERLPARLRCLYTRLMCSLFVEASVMDKVAETRTTFVMDDLNNIEHALPPPIHALDSDVDMHNSLKKELLACLNTNSSFTIPGPTESGPELTLALTELIEELTQHALGTAAVLPFLRDCFDGQPFFLTKRGDAEHGRLWVEGGWTADETTADENAAITASAAL